MKRITTTLTNDVNDKLESFCQKQDKMSKSSAISFLVTEGLKIYHKERNELADTIDKLYGRRHK